MEEFEIRCTPQQAQKALQLGASIEHARVVDTIEGKSIRIPEDTGDFYICPTFGEMRGWIEKQGIHVDVCYESENRYYYVFDFDDFISDFFPTRKEAAIAAIDAALEYLSNNKK